MSVINQMLSALDARRAKPPSEADEGVIAWVDPAADEQHGRRRLLTEFALCGVVALATVSLVDWPFGAPRAVQGPRPVAITPDPAVTAALPVAAASATAGAASAVAPAVAVASATAVPAASAATPMAAQAAPMNATTAVAAATPLLADGARPLALPPADPEAPRRARAMRAEPGMPAVAPRANDDGGPQALSAESAQWSLSARSSPHELRTAPEPPAGSGSAEKRPIAGSAAQRVASAYAQAGDWAASGHSGQALEKALEVLALDPDHQLARQLAAVLLCEAKRFDDAAALLRTGLQRQPQQPQFAYLLARLQVEAGDAPGALAVLSSQQALGAEGHALKAGVLLRQGRAGDAVEAYQSLLRLSPDNATGWLGLGLALEAEGRLADAKLALQRARGAGGLQGDLLAYVDQKLAGMQ